MKDAVIIGAGIGGLTTAYYLEKAGLDVALLEAADCVGGVIKSSLIDGFLIEHASNSSYAKPALVNLANEVGLGEDLLYPNPNSKNQFLAVSRKQAKPFLAPVPKSLLQALKSPILSPLGKMRILREPFIHSCNKEDECVHSFLSRRVGQELVENVVAAVLSGIWASNIETLSARSALPKLWGFEQEFGSILKGALKTPKEDRTRRPPMLTLRHGMQTLTEAIKEQLKPETLMLSTRASKCTIRGENLSVHFAPPRLLCGQNGTGSSVASSLDTKRLILTTPAAVSASLLAGEAAELSAKIASVPYAPLGVVHLAYPKANVEHTLDGFGFLVPPKPNLALLGAVFSSSVFPGRAPEGWHLLTCFAGGAANPQNTNVTESRVLEQLVLELRSLIGASEEPKILSGIHYPAAIPNYPLGHYQLQTALDEYEAAHPQVRFLANWRKGLSVTDRIDNAKTLAEELISEKSSKHSRGENTEGAVAQAGP